jgi:hypothetical protein
MLMHKAGGGRDSDMDSGPNLPALTEAIGNVGYSGDNAAHEKESRRGERSGSHGRAESNRRAADGYCWVLGVVVGAVSNSLMNAHVQQEQRKLSGILESFKVETGNYPVEVMQVKQFFDQLTYLTIIPAAAVKKLAANMRRYPNCWNSLADSCKSYYVEAIRVLREELKSGDAPTEDIEVVMGPKFLQARKALEHLQSK